MLGNQIPYEKQADERWCGAAALRMVYRSFGLDDAQPDIWARIVHPAAEYARAASSYRLAQDALARGLDALVLRAREPWPMLERCLELSVRAIVNHRPKLHGLNGHFSVLADLTAAEVVLHDPLVGPEQRVPRDTFAQLWAWSARGGLGQVLIAVAAPAQRSSGGCSACAQPVPAEQQCPGCQHAIPLQPAALLGCWLQDCARRTWDTVFCPQCDRIVHPQSKPFD